MESRISLITFGVRDLERSAAFYERLGFERRVRGVPGVAFFQCGCLALSLFPLEDLRRDAALDADAPAGFAGVAVAHNVRSEAEVDTVLQEAEAAGAGIAKPAAKAEWGGYSGYFRDPDGYLWEVAYNPGFPLEEDGAVRLPE